MPSTPFSGVRISWLMLARKTDFWRLASLARVTAASRSAAELLALGAVADRQSNTSDAGHVAQVGGAHVDVAPVVARAHPPLGGPVLSGCASIIRSF